ncbi:unnamed protein product [Cylindrotheca closterium]|uniref:GST N-terminal domain-containing protein n=1 Tax=Cylindrotheca closterium TaxID=2856 RepID=A0AAD2FT23_9STRA|nr:unnamed protein product [Cylindrotheca closterium]
MFHSILAFTLLCQGAAFLQSNRGQRYAVNKLHSVPTALDTLTSGLASIVRVRENGLAGVGVAPDAKAQGGFGLKLYDVENSRDCRLVRELVTELDLVVDIVPVGKGSKHKPPKEVPCLVAISDGGEETVVSGVNSIRKFLKNTFSEEASEVSTDTDTLQQVVEAITPVSLTAAGLLRTGRGISVALAASASNKVNKPEKKLILYSYEGNQFCRLVREVLTELDISYELRSAGKKSPRRDELAGITGGSTQCPYLVDPNTDTSLAESADIIRHLYASYASWTPPSEILQWASQSIIPAAKPIFKFTAPLQAGSSDEDSSKYDQELEAAKSEIKEETASAPVVVYTYELSPFSFEVKSTLESLKVEYKEISLGKEWLPGLIAPNGSIKRAALLDMTGQSSLPHIFIGGKPIGGLFSGEPGLIPLLEQDKLSAMLEDAMACT